MSEEMKNRDLTLLLESMKAQEKAAKRTLWHQRIRTVLVLLLVIAILSLIAPVKNTLNNADIALSQVETLTTEAGKAVDELMLTVEALDLDNTLAGIDALVADSSAVVESSAADIQRSLESISSLDIEGLNNSIQALEAVTTTIGRLFGYKG